MTTRDEIEARLKAAIKGPWQHYRAKLRPQFETRINEVHCRDGTPIVVWGGFDNSSRTEGKHAANAALIAHAPTDLRHLLDALAAAEAEVKRLRSLVEKFLRTDWKDEPQALWRSIDRLTEEAEELLAKDATP